MINLQAGISGIIPLLARSASQKEINPISRGRHASVSGGKIG